MSTEEEIKETEERIVMKPTTTLNQIRDKGPCPEGWGKLLRSLDKKDADDEPLSFEYILESNGIEDATWCLCVLDYNQCRMFMADVAESVLCIFEKAVPGDTGPRDAIATARNMESTESERAAAEAAARDAAMAAWAAGAAAMDADGATWAAWAAEAAARDAAGAAWAAARAAAEAAARDAAGDAAGDAKWQEIELLFVEHFCTEGQTSPSFVISKEGRNLI